MNGHQHFLEGERQLSEAYENASTPEEGIFHLTASTNHFLAALVALIAEDKQLGSIPWRNVLGPETLSRYPEYGRREPTEGETS